MGCRKLTYQNFSSLKIVYRKKKVSEQKKRIDYYPFGMPMPGRQIVNGQPYRYAFQGQEKDPETGKEAFELRLWDGRIGRWLTTDPAGQYFSPYMGMGNNPMNGVDPDGAFWGELWNWVKGNGWNTNQQLMDQYKPFDGIKLDEVVVIANQRTKGSNHIDFGINSHIIPSFGVSQNLGVIGNTTNGGLALPQDFGSWNSAGSDGRQWIGCMACHGNNGAYRTLAYDSPSAWAGRSIAATINIFGSSVVSGLQEGKVTVGQWMTKEEYLIFKTTRIIPRGNVLSKGSQGFSDPKLTHYVEFRVHPSLLKIKDINKGWEMVLPNNGPWVRLNQLKGNLIPQAKASDINLIIGN